MTGSEYNDYEGTFLNSVESLEEFGLVPYTHSPEVESGMGFGNPFDHADDAFQWDDRRKRRRSRTF